MGSEAFQNASFENASFGNGNEDSSCLSAMLILVHKICFRHETGSSDILWNLNRRLGHLSKIACSMPKKIGGSWIDECTTFHGGKFICTDGLKYAIENDECLIYSFGSPSTNLTFEVA